jgi:hypothetical protein
MVLTKKLEKKVDQFQASMQTMTNRLTVGEARMAQFETNQIKLGINLQKSQYLLNSTVNVVNEHSTVLETHKKQLNDHQRNVLILQQQVIENEQATINRFLYLAIHDILNGRQTLGFLHPYEMHLVITNILQETNITIPNIAEPLPIVEFITKLIIRQQIDFVPAERYSNTPGTEIGKLMLTTFYAMPNEQKSNFDVHKIIAGPFIHHNKVIRLAQMPSYVGINRKENSSIIWTNDDLSSCIFDIITTCRETPAETTLGNGNLCLEQILSGSKLLNCRTEQTKINLPYIQQLQSGSWLISTNNTSLHCIQTATQSKLITRTAIWNENSAVILPPVAIISVTNGTTIHCPGFNLPGPITPDTKSIINIIKNLSTIEVTSEIIDMHKELASNETWEKLPYLNGDVDALIQEMVAQTTQAPINNAIIPWHTRHSGKILIVIFIIIGILGIIIAILIKCVKKPMDGGITIALPHITT